MAVPSMFVDFIDVKDRFGTPVWKLGVDLKVSILRDGLNSIWSPATDFIVAILQLVGSYSVWLLDLVVGSDTIVSLIGEAYQSILDRLYAVVNPLQLAGVAVTILVLRMYIGEKVAPKGPGAKKPAKFTFQQENILSSESFRKKILDQAGQILLLLALIAYFMSNPFLLVQNLIKLTNSIANSLSGSLAGPAGDAGSTSALVDGLYAPMMQMINFGEPLSADCSEEWSQAWARGGDGVSDLSCLSGAQSQFAEVSTGSFLAALAGLVMMVGFLLFSVAAVEKVSLYTAKSMGLSALIAWRAVGMLAYPGQERTRLEKVYQSFRDCVVAWAWMSGAILLALVGPSVVTAFAAGFIRLGFPTFIAMLAMSVLYGVAGVMMHRHFGKRLVANPERKWFPFKVDDSDTSVTTWSGAWTAFKESSKVSKARKAYDTAKDLFADEDEDGSGSGKKPSEKEGGAAAMSPEEAEVIDEASSPVEDLVGDASSATVPLMINARRTPGGELVPVPDAAGTATTDPSGGPGAGPAAVAAGAVTVLTSVQQWNRYMQETTNHQGARWVASEQVGSPERDSGDTAAAGVVIDGEIVADRSAEAADRTAAAVGGHRPQAGPDQEAAHAVADSTPAMESGEVFRRQVSAMLDGQEAPAGDRGAAFTESVSAEGLSDDVVAAGLAHFSGDVTLDEVAESALRDLQIGVQGVEGKSYGPPPVTATIGTGAVTSIEEGILAGDCVDAEFQNANYIAKMLGIVLKPVVESGHELSFDVDANGQTVIRFTDIQGFGDDV